MNLPRTDLVTPYDRLAWTDDEIESLLASGERRRELVAVFGSALYQELAGLARVAQRVSAARGPRVWLLPGIMGSRLGRARANNEPADTIWLDPIDVIAGRLTELDLAATAPVQSLGILHFSYLRLKLQLAAAGYAVRGFDYDWRLGVLALGAQFAACLRDDARDCMIVAHSMGGLVARAALVTTPVRSVRRLVMLGTPNNGSWATVQALRGTYSVVRRLAQLDQKHDAATLARDVFACFQSLYDLLPGVASGADYWLTGGAWPTQGLQPNPQRLAAAAVVAAGLLPADERCICVAGEGDATVVAAQGGTELTYTVSTAGDGTVATAAAMLPGAHAYFARSSHGDLTRDARVGSAVVELLHTGSTRLLATQAAAPAAAWEVSETALWALPHPKLDWASLSIDQRRIFLESLNEPLPR